MTSSYVKNNFLVSKYSVPNTFRNSPCIIALCIMVGTYISFVALSWSRFFKGTQQ